MKVSKIRLIFGLVFFLRLAHGNYVGNDTQNFNPIPNGLDFVTVHSSEVLAPGFFNSGFFLNEGKNSLPSSKDAQGNTVTSKDSVTFGDISFAYGVANSLEMGLSISYLLNQTIDRSLPGAQFVGTGLNEMRLLGKYQWSKREPIGVSLITSMNLNQSMHNPFSGTDSGATVNIEGAVDYKIGKFLIAGNAGYRARTRGKKIDGALFEPLPDQIISSLATSYYMDSADLKIIAEIFAAKTTESIPYIDSNQISSELLLGAKYDIHSLASVHMGMGTHLGDGLYTPDWRIYLGLNINLDILKKAQHQPASETLTQSAPMITMYKGYQPSDIEQLKEVPFDTLAKKHEFRLRTTVPESDFHGSKPPFEIIRLDNFDFDFGSSKIRPENYQMLDNLATYLASDPPIYKARIEGHTDSLGSPERNRKRGQERADSVTAYLRKHPIVNRIKLESVGFGSDRPIADNSNFQGRQRNRRVEIRILRQPPPSELETNNSIK